MSQFRLTEFGEAEFNDLFSIYNESPEQVRFCVAARQVYRKLTMQQAWTVWASFQTVHATLSAFAFKGQHPVTEH